MSSLTAQRVEEIAATILRRRKQCLVHRFIYYVRSESMIDDRTYDFWQKELDTLVHQYPDIAATVAYADDCPSRKVGSSNLWDYPRELQHAGDSLLEYNPGNLEWWSRVTSPEFKSEELHESTTYEDVQPRMF